MVMSRGLGESASGWMAPQIDRCSLTSPLLMKCDEPSSISVDVRGMPTPIVTWHVGNRRVKKSSGYRTTSDGQRHTLVISTVSEELEKGVWVMATNDLGEDSCLITVQTYKVLTGLQSSTSFHDSVRTVHNTAVMLSRSATMQVTGRRPLTGRPPAPAATSAAVQRSSSRTSSLEEWQQEMAIRNRMRSVDDLMYYNTWKKESMQSINSTKSTNIAGSADLFYDGTTSAFNQSFCSSTATTPEYNTTGSRRPRRLRLRKRSRTNSWCDSIASAPAFRSASLTRVGAQRALVETDIDGKTSAKSITAPGAQMETEIDGSIDELNKIRTVGSRAMPLETEIGASMDELNKVAADRVPATRVETEIDVDSVQPKHHPPKTRGASEGRKKTRKVRQRARTSASWCDVATMSNLPPVVPVEFSPVAADIETAADDAGGKKTRVVRKKTGKRKSKKVLSKSVDCLGELNQSSDLLPSDKVCPSELVNEVKKAVDVLSPSVCREAESPWELFGVPLNVLCSRLLIQNAPETGLTSQQATAADASSPNDSPEKIEIMSKSEQQPEPSLDNEIVDSSGGSSAVSPVNVKSLEVTKDLICSVDTRNDESEDDEVWPDPPTEFLEISSLEHMPAFSSLSAKPVDIVMEATASSEILALNSATNDQIAYDVDTTVQADPLPVQRNFSEVTDPGPSQSSTTAEPVPREFAESLKFDVVSAKPAENKKKNEKRKKRTVEQADVSPAASSKTDTQMATVREFCENIYLVRCEPTKPDIRSILSETANLNKFLNAAETFSSRKSEKIGLRQVERANVARSMCKVAPIQTQFRSLQVVDKIPPETRTVSTWQEVQKRTNEAWQHRGVTKRPVADSLDQRDEFADLDLEEFECDFGTVDLGDSVTCAVDDTYEFEDADDELDINDYDIV